MSEAGQKFINSYFTEINIESGRCFKINIKSSNLSLQGEGRYLVENGVSNTNKKGRVMFSLWRGEGPQRAVCVKTVHQFSANESQSCGLWVNLDKVWRSQNIKNVDLPLPPALLMHILVLAYDVSQKMGILDFLCK